MTFTSLDKNKFIEIEPQSIQFDDLQKKSSIASVRIRNVFSTNIVFKVKTTAPRAYVVKPNQSVLAPGDSMEVQFCMNPTETYPSVQNSKDRFMIAATDVGTLAYGYNLNSIWTEKPQSAIQQTKLAPVFVRAPVTSTQENNVSISNDNNRVPNLGQPAKSIQMSDSISSISNSLNNSAMDDLKKTYSNKGNYVESNAERNNMAMTQKRNFNIDTDTHSQQYNPMRNSEHNPANISIYGSQQYNQANDRHLSKSFSGQSMGGVIASSLDYKKEYEKLLSKVEEQEKNLLKASEDRNRIYSELSSLKENLSKRKISSIKSAAPKENNAGGFQLLHLILVAVVSLLLGAFFSV